MQISNKRLWIEAAAGTAIVLGGTAVASGAPHLGIGKLCPHPVWLVVLALSARYGVRGLVASAPVAWGALALLGGSWRTAPVLALKALATPSELGALAGALIVGLDRIGSRASRARSGREAGGRRRQGEPRCRCAWASCGKRRWPCARATIVWTCR